MNLKIRSGTVGYNNKILVSDGKFSLRKNDMVNSLEAPATQTADSIEVQTQNQEPQTDTHEEEKIALVLFLAGGFAIWNMF